MVSMILRVGLAFVLLYAAVSSFLDPNAWLGFFPVWLRELIPQKLLLNGFSVYEILLALWLLSGKQTFYAAGLTALSLLGIIVFNLGAMDVIFRDIGLFASAVALIVLHKNPNKIGS